MTIRAKCEETVRFGWDSSIGNGLPEPSSQYPSHKSSLQCQPETLTSLLGLGSKYQSYSLSAGSKQFKESKTLYTLEFHFRKIQVFLNLKNNTVTKITRFNRLKLFEFCLIEYFNNFIHLSCYSIQVLIRIKLPIPIHIKLLFHLQKKGTYLTKSLNRTSCSSGAEEFYPSQVLRYGQLSLSSIL